MFVVTKPSHFTVAVKLGIEKATIEEAQLYFHPKIEQLNHDSSAGVMYPNIVRTQIMFSHSILSDSKQSITSLCGRVRVGEYVVGQPYLITIKRISWCKVHKNAISLPTPQWPPMVPPNRSLQQSLHGPSDSADLLMKLLSLFSGWLKIQAFWIDLQVVKAVDSLAKKN